MRYLITIVGMKYRERYEDHIHILRDDLRRARGFKLEFEPENKHDEFAIRALLDLGSSDWYHFGYVSRDFNRNSDLRNIIENGPAKIELSHPESTVGAVKLRVYK
jgi:hypothetical protein